MTKLLVACKVCGEPAAYKAKALCRKHYDRERLTGDAFNADRNTRGLSTRERLDSFRIIPEDPDACYGWSGALLNKGGYALISFGGAPQLAHRVAFAEEVAPLIDGMEIDHQCHNEDLTCPGGDPCPHRPCTRSDHLRQVTPKQNTRRAAMTRRPGTKALKSACKHGHAYTPENTTTDRLGYRSCRQCRRDEARRYRQRKKDAQ